MPRYSVGHTKRSRAPGLIVVLLGVAAAAWWTQARQQPGTDAETARRLRIGGAG
jgi:hypothetical protein